MIECCSIVYQTTQTSTLRNTRNNYCKVVVGLEVWVAVDIQSNHQEFRTLLMTAIQSREDIVIRCHQRIDNWRYVTVAKKVMFDFRFAGRGDQGRIEPRCPAVAKSQRVFATNESTPNKAVSISAVASELGIENQTEAALSACARAMVKTMHANELVAGYRLLVDYCRLSPKHAVMLPEIWRMFQSPVGEIYYLQGINVTLREMISDALGRKALNVGGKGCGVDLEAISRMIEAFVLKSRDVITRKMQLVPSPVRRDIMYELTLLWPPEAELALEFDDMLVEALERIHKHFTYMSQFWAAEIHCLMPGAEAFLGRGIAEEGLDPAFSYATKECYGNWVRRQKKSEKAAMKSGVKSVINHAEVPATGYASRTGAKKG
jgi:hypothetical protein